MVGERGQPGGVVGEHLGGGAAESEQDQGPEDLVLDDSGEQFGAARGERLHDHTGQQSGEPGLQITEGGAHLVVAPEVEVDGALGALVQQTRPVPVSYTHRTASSSVSAQAQGSWGMP